MSPHGLQHLEPGHALQDLEEKDPFVDAQGSHERRVEEIAGTPSDVRQPSTLLSQDLLEQIYGCNSSSGCRQQLCELTAPATEIETITSCHRATGIETKAEGRELYSLVRVVQPARPSSEEIAVVSFPKLAC
jgi:hypothetical protein